jgi:hypothetical protein
VQQPFMPNFVERFRKITENKNSNTVPLVLLLFILYINNVAENLISLSRIFADDTSFSYSSRDELQIKIVIDHDLKELKMFAGH